MKKPKFSDRSTTTESSTASDEPGSDEHASDKLGSDQVEIPAKEQKPAIAMGMVPYKWSGVNAWMCPDCKSSTTNKERAMVHVCQQIQYYKPEGEDQ